MKTSIHFAHGNGFPSLCYRQLLDYLAPHYTCFYIDKVGHSHEYPVTENWEFLVQEVIASIRKQTDKPVIGVGHSLGGILTLLAGIKAPQLFSQIVLLDAPFLNPLKSQAIKFIKKLGIIDHLTPAARARVRQAQWESREAVWNYLKGKELFKYFTEQCLNDYIDYGLQQNEEKYQLRFNREIESRIYRTIPHIFSKYEGLLKVPTGLIYGRQSKIMNSLDRRYMQKQYNISSFPIEGTHMFPMEKPKETAELIVKVAQII